MLNKLCLSPSTEITFSIKEYIPILMLPIAMIFLLESSSKVTVPPSIDLDSVAKLLIFHIMLNTQHKLNMFTLHTLIMPSCMVKFMHVLIVAERVIWLNFVLIE